MNSWISKLTSGGLLLLLGASICLGGYSALLSHRLELARQQVSEQQNTLAQQAGLITTLHANDAHNRLLMSEQQRREQQLRQRGEIYQRKYEDAIKNDECASRAAPGVVLDLLRGKDTSTTGADRSVAP